MPGQKEVEEAYSQEKEKQLPQFTDGRAKFKAE